MAYQTIIGGLMLALFCLTGIAEAQSGTRLRRSALNMGYQTYSDAANNQKLRSVLGEVLVKRSTSGSTQLKSGFNPDVSAPAGAGMIFIVQNDTPMVGSRPIIFFRTPDGFAPTNLQIFYRKAGERQYQSGTVTQTTAGFLPDIPAEQITARGLEYYLRFSAGEVEATFPPFDPQNNPAVVRVAVNREVSPQPLVRRVHRMISVPFFTGNRSIFEQLSDDYGDYGVLHWRLFRYVNGDYVEHPALGGELQPGLAYWLVTAEGESFDIGQGLSTNSADDYQIALQPGWNQIANPWAFAISWSDVQSAGLPDGPVFYDGSQYIPEQSVLFPWEGYWLFNPSSETTVISIPPVEYLEDRKSTSANQPVFVINPEKEYLLQLSAALSNGNYPDSYNYLGLMEQAKEGPDRLDIHEPPPIGEYLQLSITADSLRYAASIKPPGLEGQRWDLEIRGNIGTDDVQLNLQAEGKLPEGQTRYIMDLDYRFTYAVQHDRIVVSRSREYPVRRLRVILGSEAFANANAGGIPLIPLEFALEQNYPNPFNPETTIRYQLQQVSEVQLEIYNVLGQRVRSLVRGKQDTGVHTMIWDGRNDQGAQVASGIYIYRLRAGTFVEARKMVLVR